MIYLVLSNIQVIPLDDMSGVCNVEITRKMFVRLVDVTANLSFVGQQNKTKYDIEVLTHRPTHLSHLLFLSVFFAILLHIDR